MASKKTSKKKYGATTQKKVAKVMHERKVGTLRSGGSKNKVTNRKQAIAIALSEARAAGGKVPPPPKKQSARKKASKKASNKKAASRRSAKKKPS